MADPMTAMPTRVAAWLVAGHVENLWSQWANDKDMPGCCPTCCGPCAGLKELYDRGELDGIYGAYAEQFPGGLETWDAEKRQIRRDWLLQAWSVRVGCHEVGEEGESGD